MSRSPALVCAALLASTALVAACANETGAERRVAPTKLEASDLVIVYPLPTAAEMAALPGTADPQTGVARLPREVFGRGALPELDATEPLDAEAAWASLRVVAARLDPCPGVVLPPRAVDVCTPELRLVFQSIVADEDGGAHARDGALHAFYALPDGSFGALRDRLSAASPISSRGPLSVHPRLLTEGLHGPFADELSAIFATFATGPRLFRVTHFRRLAPSADGPAYAFRLRDRRGETFFDENVPATWAPEQTAFPLASAPRIAPSITAEDDVTAVFRAASDARAAAFGATARVLDPAVHSSESTDCASCHLAGSIARQASRRYGLDAGDAAGVSTSGSPVWPTAAETADDDLHLLSYRGRTLTIAARTRHEIAASLAFINRVDE